MELNNKLLRKIVFYGIGDPFKARKWVDSRKVILKI